MTNPELAPLYIGRDRTKRIEEAGRQIARFISNPEQKVVRLISQAQGTRFIVCGTSGSGKTRAIALANSLLPSGGQIAESQELLREKSLAKAIEISSDIDFAYEASLHIGFNVINGYLAKALERHGVKVFWLDRGSFSHHWKDSENNI